MTVEQFQRFVKPTTLTIALELASLINKYSPDPNGPWIGSTGTTPPPTATG